MYFRSMPRSPENTIHTRASRFHADVNFRACLRVLSARHFSGRKERLLVLYAGHLVPCYLQLSQGGKKGLPIMLYHPQG